MLCKSKTKVLKKCFFFNYSSSQLDDHLLVNVSLTLAIAQSSFFSSILASSYVSSVPLRQSLIEMHSLTIRRGWSMLSISFSVSAFSSLNKRISLNNFCSKSSSTSFHLDTSVTLPKRKYYRKLYISFHKYRSNQLYMQTQGTVKSKFEYFNANDKQFVFAPVRQSSIIYMNVPFRRHVSLGANTFARIT